MNNKTDTNTQAGKRIYRHNLYTLSLMLYHTQTEERYGNKKEISPFDVTLP